MRDMVAKRAELTLLPLKTGLVPFNVVVYGRSAAELMTVPNEVIGVIADRYPDYQGSPFMIRDLGEPVVNVQMREFAKAVRSGQVDRALADRKRIAGKA